ncbi:MAG: UDP-N-acetylmuramate dehydrogenase [Pseudomonadota bacterium]
MNAVAVALPDFDGLRVDEPMSKHTSWRVGGPADIFYKPASADELGRFLRELPADMPVHFVGLGSNLLVRDGGIRGAVVVTTGLYRTLEQTGPLSVRAGAGVACTRLARRAVQWGLGPAEFFAGIPGTVGGALTMNAGAFGGETWERVREIETIGRDGVARTRSPGDYTVGYRSVRGPAGEWFSAAMFEFEPGYEASVERMEAMVARRKATQPLGVPSCGSVFRNPDGDHAARLIEAAGLKGFRVGAAEVSPKHANFVVNTGAATAADIEAVINHVLATVETIHGVRLQHEVRMLGEPA